MNEWMNTKQLARYLNVNEKLIYDFADKRGLPGTLITGKWLFKKDLVDLWLEESMKNTSFHLARLSDVLLAVGSNDLLLERTFERILPTVTFFSSTGSLRAIEVLKEKRAHLAGAHLFSDEKGTYNIPFIEGLAGTVVVNLAWRDQGLLCAKGNPLGLRGAADLAVKKARIVNRQKGSGTRLLLDDLLNKEGVRPTDLAGYDNEVSTHLDVGLRIHKGEADAGIGIQAVAGILDLQFIPLRKERYDILIPKIYFFIKPIQVFIETIRSDWFKKTSVELGGYDTGESGKIIYEN